MTSQQTTQPPPPKSLEERVLALEQYLEQYKDALEQYDALKNNLARILWALREAVREAIKTLERQTPPDPELIKALKKLDEVCCPDPPSCIES